MESPYHHIPLNDDDDPVGREEDNKKKKKKKKKRVVRKFTRGKKCLTLLWKFTDLFLNHPVGVIFLQIGLAITGLVCSISACAYAEHWFWPFLTFICALSPLIPLLICGGVDKITEMATSNTHDNPFHNGSDGLIKGWIVLGITMFLPFLCPVVVACLQVISSPIVWLSAVGAWCLLSAIVFYLASVIKAVLDQRRAQNSMYDETESDSDSDSQADDKRERRERERNEIYFCVRE